MKCLQYGIHLSKKFLCRRSMSRNGSNPIGILGQVWYLIVSIPDLCTFTYFNLALLKDIKYDEPHFVSFFSTRLNDIP